MSKAFRLEVLSTYMYVKADTQARGTGREVNSAWRAQAHESPPDRAI